MSVTAEQIKVVSAPVALWKALKHTPHAGQLRLYELASRVVRHFEDAPIFLNVTTSRRWGKTEAVRVLLWDGALQPADEFGPPYVPLISDTHEHASKGWDRFLKDLYTNDYFRAMLVNHDRERERVTLKNGAILQRFSTDSPESVSGEGATLAIIDESQDVGDEGMTNFLPSLTERHGRAIAFGVAQNDGGWFDTWEERGDDPDFPEYGHLAFPWYTNPFLDKRMIDLFARDLSKEDFERLYMAHRPNKGETLWSNLSECITTLATVDPGLAPYPIEPPQDGHRYIAGLDVAKDNDYTVLMIFDYDTRRLVYFHRMGHEEYKVQGAKLAPPLAHYAAHCLMDMTGVGNAVIEQFRSSLDDYYNNEWQVHGSLDWLTRRASYEGVTWNNQEKVDMVSRARVHLEHETVHFPNISPFIREMKKYRKLTTPSGKVTYGAPTGFHDDTVSAFLLCAKQLPTTITSKVGTPPRHKAGWEYIK